MAVRLVLKYGKWRINGKSENETTFQIGLYSWLKLSYFMAIFYGNILIFYGNNCVEIGVNVGHKLDYIPVEFKCRF